MDTLHYVADPMCSWCWGFRSARDEVFAALGDRVSVRYVMGGLAPDTDEEMPMATRTHVQAAWRAVAAATGARFDWTFWERCTPRRSTYPACRAVLAAGAHGPAMFDAIQEAYYLRAENPSDEDTLAACAARIGLDREAFTERLRSPETAAALQTDLALRRRLGVDAFPSLVLERRTGLLPLARGYATADEILSRWRGCPDTSGG